MDTTTFVGLDVHVATIQMAVIRPGQDPLDVGRFPNRPDQLLKRLAALAPPDHLQVCYEAGPTGYGIARHLDQAGISCLVAAPSLIPRKPGDRVKTDPRDAVKLARLLKSNDLTPVAIPTHEQEALRALSRAYEAAKRDRHRLRQRLIKLLQQQGIHDPGGCRWTKQWRRWLDTVRLPQPAAQVVLSDLRDAIRQTDERVASLRLALETAADAEPVASLASALQTLHGVGPITALGLIAELGDLTRFASAEQLFAYAGLIPSEHSSGGRVRRGSITRIGNSHVRFLAVEAAWHYVHPPKPLFPTPASEIERIAAAARIRLHKRFHRLVSRGKSRQQAIVAIARELLAKVWAIARAVAQAQLA